MARVVLTGNLRRLVPGTDAAQDGSGLEVEGDTIRKILNGLGERYPELAPHLEDGIAVAVDGTIYQDSWYEPVGPDSEIHIMPAIAGG